MDREKDEMIGTNLMLFRELILKYMSLFRLGIIFHIFKISGMRNDRFSKDKYFTAFCIRQRFRSSRFTSEHMTSPPLRSLRITGPLSIVHVFVVFVLHKSVFC